MRRGGIGVIEEGKLKGRRFIIPSEVYVEKGSFPGGTNYAKACLIHQKFVPDQGCQECVEDTVKKTKENTEIGL